MARIRVDGFNRFGFVNDASPEDLPPAAFSYVRNARFSHLGVDTFEGESSIFSTPTVTPLWYKFFPPPATPLLVYGNLTKMYAYDGTTHTEITRVASNYAGNAAERWQGEVFQGVGIFNNVLDVPQHWSSFATGTKLIDLANWPANYKCRTLRPFKNFLFAMHPYESGVAKPYRVRWSHPAAPGTIPTSWDISDATKDAREVDLATTPGIIHDGLELGDQFIVYKEDSAYAFSYIGPPFIFRNDPVVQGRGILWRDCVQKFPRGHFVVGTDDIYVHSGIRGSDESVVEGRLRSWVFAQLNASNYFNCFTMAYPQKNEIWFCFPEAGATYATIALVWNTLTGVSGVRAIPASPFAVVGPAEDLSGVLTW